MAPRPFPRSAGRMCSYTALLLLAVLSGCANLAAVREFAKTSAATADYRVIVDDYVTTPSRLKAYSPADQAAKRDAQVKEREAQREGLMAVQKTLVVYMDTIGKLAADDLPSLDAELKTLKGSLDKIPISDAAEAAKFKEATSAAQTILGILGKWALEGYRQTRLVEVIREADQHVQSLTTSLSAMLTGEMANDVDGEETGIRLHFEKSLIIARAIADKAKALTAQLPKENEAGYKRETVEAVQGLLEELETFPTSTKLLTDYVTQDASSGVRSRRSDLEAYAAILKKIAKGHGKLRESDGHLSTEALKVQLKTYSNDLKDLYKALGKNRR